MTTHRCRTQAELDAAVAEAQPTDNIDCIGGEMFVISGSATVRAYDSATVHAYGSATVHAYGSATVRAYGSATIHAYGSATVHAYDAATVRASGSATVRAYGSATVRAYDSATVHAYGSATVHAYGSATVRAYDSVTIHATRYVGVTRHSLSANIEGGVIIDLPPIRTAAEWCEFRGVTVVNGVATLYKAVRANYHSARGGDYTPGTTPVAPDWDGGVAECGGGLHFVAHPHEGLMFDTTATHYVSCPVALADIIVHENPQYPNKVKAKGCCGPVWECDIDGNRVEVAQEEQGND